MISGMQHLLQQCRHHVCISQACGKVLPTLPVRQTRGAMEAQERFLSFTKKFDGGPEAGLSR